MTIHILGLGETLEDFVPDGNITIGVNDIHSRFKSDYVVCVDCFRAFTPERMKVIRETRCKGFYSHLDEWRNVQNFNKVIPIMPRGSVEKIDEDGLVYSVISPFVACVLAYKMGATKIVLWGVDLMSHPQVKDQLREIALKDLRKLNKVLNEKGVEMYVGDDFSYLSTFLAVYTPGS
jgi:hypothetical protein